MDALRVRNLHPKENLALRDFGGECGQDDGSRVLVSFGTSRRNRILKAAAALQPRGKPTLASAVISALADLQPLAHTKRVVVLTGDAELNEGSNWEAILLAPALHLTNLTLLVIDNHSSSVPMGPWQAKLDAFGWSVRVVDGHDHDTMRDALATRDELRPTAVVADIPEGEW